MSALVFVKPANDNPALVLEVWGGRVERDAGANGHPSAASLSGATVTRQAVDNNLSAGDAFYYFGHGTWTTLEGPMVLVDNTNVALLAGRLVIAVACQAAHTLGHRAVTAGAQCFLGFDDNLIWAFPVGGGDPFGNAVVDGLRLLVTRRTAGDAFQALQLALDAIFQRYKYHSTDTNRVFLYVFADWDRRHLRLYGNAMAQLP